ncbi:MAG: hypothetical protein ACTSVK_01695 [Promethearchaeota archaeon]
MQPQGNQNSFQRVKKRIREIFFPTKTARLNSLQDDYSNFSEKNLSCWQQYPNYLLSEEETQLKNQLINLKKRARKYGFLFSEIVNPLKHQLRVDMEYIEKYNN